MYRFVNRSAEIVMICEASSPQSVLNIFGESGIGKTRLLKEAIARLADSLVIDIDLESLSEIKPAQRAARLIELLAEQLAGADVEQLDSDVRLDWLVAELAERSRIRSVFLFFDTTEALQDDIDFWRWLEASLMSPLVFEPSNRFVFAGRIPVPFSRIEVRRVLKLLHLTPLATNADREASAQRRDGSAGRELVREVLVRHNPRLTGDQLQQATDLVLEFSFGHPLLSEQMALFVAEQSAAGLDVDNRHLAQAVVKPFIDSRLFDKIDEPWKRILELASVLDWFDPIILMRFLRNADPQLVLGQGDDFFIQGVRQLRQQHTVVWRDERGDTLHGVIAAIVRYYLRVAEPDIYRDACSAAEKTFREFAEEEHPVASPEYEIYLQQADLYHRRAQETG